MLHGNMVARNPRASLSCRKSSQPVSHRILNTSPPPGAAPMSRPAVYIDSYYSASAPLLPPFAPIAGEVDCDVCVIGGGIAGCSSALHLAERGYRVVLLEDKRIGWGASGRMGAQALP